MTSSDGGRTPIVGISAYCEQARWGVWDLPATVLPRRYADRVAQAGGIPLLLPPAAGIEAVMPRLDALVLSGGGDIDPARYGQPPGPRTTAVSEDRDAAELALLAAALAAGRPVLGICRGMQLMNLACGGTLHQHLPDVVGHHEHGPRPGSFVPHDVTVAPGSVLATILGSPGPHPVPSHHHQGIDRLGAGLTATAWTADGIIEAVEHTAPDGGFCVGVQWHPEAGSDLSLFTALVAAGRAVTADPAASGTGPRAGSTAGARLDSPV